MSHLLDERGTPCPTDIASQFTCIPISVPLDHSAADSPVFDVVFGVRPATGQRQGFFVTVTGGPGSAGLYSADSYSDGMPPEILEHFDIVFFDQRGVGLSGNVYCGQSVATYYDFDSNTLTQAGEAAFAQAAQTFANDCLNELDQTLARDPSYSTPQWLDLMGTQQAAEDLEAFRQAVGDDKFYLYGESYGTQFAQTYAAAHPDHLSGLLLDGTVDLTITGPEYLREQAQAFSDVLLLTLQACNEDQDCSQAMGADAVAVYDALATQLAAAPVSFDYTLTTGDTQSRTFSISDLEFTAVNFLYSESDRTDLLIALAAANQGDWAPLAEAHYDLLGLDYDTLELSTDPSYSDALYYTVECNDYRDYPGSAAEEAQAYLREGDSVETTIPRLASVFYGDFPCAYWPVNPDSDSRPAPLVLPGVPTLVLNATADPATPYANAVRVYSRLADGYLITKEGGPHVIFGWGYDCPDLIVADFLVNNKMPDQRETTCPGSVIEPYNSH
jgi:pimeloyl-ACP methyl ester carboxylesterase